MKVKKRWIILMASLVIIAIIGAFMPEEAGLWEFEETDQCTSANVA